MIGARGIGFAVPVVLMLLLSGCQGGPVRTGPVTPSADPREARSCPYEESTAKRVELVIVPDRQRGSIDLAPGSNRSVPYHADVCEVDPRPSIELEGDLSWTLQRERPAPPEDKWPRVVHPPMLNFTTNNTTRAFDVQFIADAGASDGSWLFFLRGRGVAQPVSYQGLYIKIPA